DDLDGTTVVSERQRDDPDGTTVVSERQRFKSNPMFQFVIHQRERKEKEKRELTGCVTTSKSGGSFDSCDANWNKAVKVSKSKERTTTVQVQEKDCKNLKGIEENSRQQMRKIKMRRMIKGMIMKDLQITLKMEDCRFEDRRLWHIDIRGTCSKIEMIELKTWINKLRGNIEYTNVIDPKPGTLRHAVLQPEPLWITFSGHMTIRLSQELIFMSGKTIDGRGFDIYVAGGAGFMFQFVHNIIIHGLHMYDIVEGYDGLIDIVAASTNITISNCHFVKHDKALLFGASDETPEDKIIKVTLAYNHFGRELTQRLPAALLFGASDETPEDKIIKVTLAYNHFGRELTQRLPAPRKPVRCSRWCMQGNHKERASTRIHMAKIDMEK
nr:pectate lyase-like [Tanacetum cinerariifolium]